jgi:hypothetical protein
MRRWLTRTATVLALAAPLTLVGGAAAVHEPMDGMSFTFLQAPFTQDVFGRSNHFMGGVAFDAAGNPIVNDCQFAGSELHKYLRAVPAPPPAEDPGTELHTEVILPSNAGCGMANHPNGSVYTNTGSGVVRLDPNTGAQTGGPFGPPGNALGIAPDPETNDLIYVGSDGTLHRVDPALTTTSVFSAGTAGRFIDAVNFDPSGDFLFLASRSPSFSLAVVNGDTGAFIRDNPMTSEPDGISFHASPPRFVVTNNTDGTMTRHDFPADDYSQASTQSVFASGGFRGDLSAVGPDGCIYLTQDGIRYDNGAVGFHNSLVKICPGFAPPPGVEICGDGIDNDGDGQIDEDCPTTHVAQHYESYDLSEPERVTEEGVTIVDQFGSRTVRLEEIEWLMNPVEKRRAGHEPVPILDADAHLTCYGLPVLDSAARSVHVRNQFVGDSTLRIGRPLTLCAPAAKTLEGAPGTPPTTVQHYQCYDVTAESPRFVSETLTLRDQFGTLTVRLDRARELCNPAEKRRTGREPEPVKSPDDHLVCYRIVSHTPAFAVRTVFTRDQFGLDTLRATSPRRLCVPSEKSEGPLPPE